MTEISFKEILSQYNLAVESTDDLENALQTLIGKTDWETNVMSDKRRSIQVLYAELKAQRNIREKLEEASYTVKEVLNSLEAKGTQVVEKDLKKEE